MRLSSACCQRGATYSFMWIQNDWEGGGVCWYSLHFQNFIFGRGEGVNLWAEKSTHTDLTSPTALVLHCHCISSYIHLFPPISSDIIILDNSDNVTLEPPSCSYRTLCVNSSEISSYVSSIKLIKQVCSGVNLYSGVTQFKSHLEHQLF
jgi:hypothetical protein